MCGKYVIELLTLFANSRCSVASEWVRACVCVSVWVSGVRAYAFQHRVFFFVLLGLNDDEQFKFSCHSDDGRLIGNFPFICSLLHYRPFPFPLMAYPTIDAARKNKFRIRVFFFFFSFVEYKCHSDDYDNVVFFLLRFLDNCWTWIDDDSRKASLRFISLHIVYDHMDWLCVLCHRKSDTKLV